MEKLDYKQMIGIARFKTVLEKDGSSYSSEELLLIRDFLYILAQFEFAAYLKEKRREIGFQKEQDNQELKEAA